VDLTTAARDPKQERKTATKSNITSQLTNRQNITPCEFPMKNWKTVKTTSRATRKETVMLGKMQLPF